MSWRPNPAHAKRLSTALRLYACALVTIWIAKTHALYGSHDIWSEYSRFYVALAAMAASYREVLVAAALCSTYYLGGRLLGERAAARRAFDTLAYAAFALLLLVNFVNAELLPKFGAPLTVPLISNSDIIASGHGRRAVWAWTGPNVLLLGLGILAALAAVDAIVRLTLKRFRPAALLILLGIGTAGVTLAGVTRSPASPNLEESGSLAMVRSLKFLAVEIPTPAQASVPPLPTGAVTRGVGRPDGIRNVVLIVLEAAAARHFDQYGGARGVTPNLAALSSDSAVVENAYSQSPSSTVALSVLLSSRYPFVSALGGPSEMAPVTPQLPGLVSAAGIRTGFFHSSDTRFQHADSLLQASGFETVRDFRHRRCDDPLFRDRYSSLGNADRCTFADLMQWIDSRPDPFFATLWTFQTHYPYFSGPDWRQPIDDRPSERVAAELRRYLGALAEADWLIGSLVRHLKQTGRYDETLIVITADHGQSFGQHGGYGNGLSLYEESIRIPLILINGKLDKASLGRLSGQVDVAPTILDALGLDVPRGWEGASLFAEAPERPIYFANMTADLVLGYRLGERKVIWNLVRGTTEAFDLSSDAGELHRRALDGAGAKREQARLAAWVERTNMHWRPAEAR